jgi:uncharacterized protein (TIGR03083 family)
MPANKDTVIEAIQNVENEVEHLVDSMPESAWDAPAYQGWSAKDLLCHIASTSGATGFLVNMARSPGSGGIGADFDQDAWNAQMVAVRRDRPLPEIVDEIRAILGQDIDTIQGVPDELLATRCRAPWGIEGPLADVIVASLKGHLLMHLKDLQKVVA